MSKKDINEILEKFNFLDKNTLREPFILDVLSEILNFQSQSSPDFDKPLATLETLKESRNIKIPYTSHREKNIDYLVEILTKNYPDQVKPVVTFDFDVDKSTKKLNLTETIEYTVLLGGEAYEKLISKRDSVSVENLLNLIKQYRFFNLSALIKRTRYRQVITRMIKLQLGKQIFTFKNHNLDKNRTEYTEDYCFHADNYDSVRNSINIKKLKDIMSNYQEFIMRRLKKFGILNTEVSDYRDSKLDYIFNILLQDLATTISDRDMVEIKNINSLQQCVIKVDRILDPIKTIGNDIVKFIRDNKICTSSDITTSHIEVTEEILDKWSEQENLKKNRILKARDEEGKSYFFDGAAFQNLFAQLTQLILHEPEKAAQMQYSERKKAEHQLNILYQAARDFLSSPESIEKNLNIDGINIDRLREFVEDYENHQKRQRLQRDLEKQVTEVRRERISIFRRILNFIKSIFTRKKKILKVDADKSRALTRPVFTKQTRQVYKKIVNMARPLIPLSEIIELIPDNDPMVDDIINELREKNEKIVIPIYKARRVLYPMRSKKILIPDVEYLLVSPQTIRSYESIREFTDSLYGSKLKDEIIPHSGISVIEKYLLTLYHQRRTQALKKEL
jgi:hypothetical protein